MSKENLQKDENIYGLYVIRNKVTNLSSSLCREANDRDGIVMAICKIKEALKNEPNSTDTLDVFELIRVGSYDIMTQTIVNNDRYLIELKEEVVDNG